MGREQSARTQNGSTDASSLTSAGIAADRVTQGTPRMVFQVASTIHFGAKFARKERENGAFPEVSCSSAFCSQLGRFPHANSRSASAIEKASKRLEEANALFTTDIEASSQAFGEALEQL